MNIKMFGTLEPDFTGATGVASLSGSHHTLAFYRKAIGHFMPAGAVEWDVVNGCGNPTRSRVVKDLGELK